MLLTIEKIKDLIQQNTNYKDVKSFYIGDPIMIPRSSLPAVIISPDQANLTVNTTAEDMYEMKINISIEVDKKSEMNKTPNEVVAERTLMEKAVAQDPTTRMFKDDSIIGILRHNFTLGGKEINQIANVRWGIKPRGETLTAVVQISFTVQELVIEQRI